MITIQNSRLRPTNKRMFLKRTKQKGMQKFKKASKEKERKKEKERERERERKMETKRELFGEGYETSHPSYQNLHQHLKGFFQTPVSL